MNIFTQHVWEFWFSSNRKSLFLSKIFMTRADFILEDLTNVKDEIFQYYSNLNSLGIFKPNNKNMKGLATLLSSIFCLTSLEMSDLNRHILRHMDIY